MDALTRTLASSHESWKSWFMKDRLRTATLPTNGRSHLVFLDKPLTDKDGTVYPPILQEKGIGAGETPVRERGEVFGTPAEKDPAMYPTVGFQWLSWA